MNNSSQLHFLSALRGFSAIWIVLYHARFLPENQFPTPLWARWFVDVGGMAVMMFFIVSAFSLMYTHPKRLSSRNPLADFYTHRVFRIVPLFLIVLVYYLLNNRIVLGHSHTPLEILSNLSLTYNLIPGYQTSIVWAGWTVGVEVMFYLIFPFIYKKCKSLLGAIQILLFSLILSSLYKNFIPYLIDDPQVIATYQQWLFIRYLPVFAMGIVCFTIWELKLESRFSKQSTKSLGLILVLVGFLMLLIQPSGIASILGDTLYVQGLCFVFITLGLSMAPLTLIVNKAISWYGNLSYSIYLLHPIVIWQSQDLTRLIYSRLPNSFAFILSTIIILILVTVVSYVSEKIVESHFIDLGKRFARRLFV